MDKTILKTKKYQKVLSAYMTQLADKTNKDIPQKEVYHYAVVDTIHNHFQLIVSGWDDDFFVHAILIHLHIHPKTGNIWILQNNTEIDIDIELERIANIPKRHFVLGFHPDYVRKHSDYAVA